MVFYEVKHKQQFVSLFRFMHPKGYPLKCEDFY